ncbi:MAG TPA: hypothetical protein VET90_08755 [Candidatus Binatus sp.]|nr:hypothetical protein [Candidatus Binatus sp.]
MGAGKGDLIERLLQEPAATPGEASSRATASATAAVPARADEAGPSSAPPGATFLVHDDWDTNRGVLAGARASRPTAAKAARRWLDRIDPAARHALRLAIVALAVVGAAAGLGVAAFHLINDPLSGARAYYDAATRLNAGHALYRAVDVASPTLAYPDPPLLAIVLRPLAVLPYWLFALAWETVVVVAFVALLGRLGVRSQRTWLAVGILGVPIGWALSTAQGQLVVGLLLAVGQPWSIALAANLGPFSILAVVWWIGRRDWQATIAVALYLVLFGLIQLVLEPTGTATFVKSVLSDQISGVAAVSPFGLSLGVWAVLLFVGIAVALMLARGRWGWPAAVALVTLASPQVPLPALTSLLAAVREPTQANLPEPQALPWQLVSGGGRH